MPAYTSDQHLKSGVPLGGLGCGKMEIMPQGGLDHFTFLNNLHHPLVGKDACGRTGIAGFHFGLFCEDKKKKTARILESHPPSGFPGVPLIRYEGRYPFARLRYEDAGLPVDVELEAFSPLIPRDEKNSGLPAAFFRFKISNPSSHAVTVSLMACGRNIAGDWGVGRFNQVAQERDLLSLYFCNKKTLPHDPFAGEMSLSVLKNSKCSLSYAGEWNMQGKAFGFDKDHFSLGDPWQLFVKDGTLGDVNTERAVNSESVQLGGALAAKTVLRAHGSVVITFVWSWFFPGFGEGRMYENWFHSVSDVNLYLVKNAERLLAGTRAWCRELNSLKIDEWLKDALANNLYPFSSSTLWTKRGRFGFFEAPEVCPLLGTLDVRFYGSAALALFFPSLDMKEISQFAEAQRPQGYVPHDLGYKRSDLASNSTNGLFWKDLNSKFILLVWRSFLLTGDEAFLKKMYPFVKKAFYWLCATDKNKDNLPDSEGADSTFDVWNLKGACAYTGSIFLAGLLALERMSQRSGDESMAREARFWYKRGRAQFEKKLFYKDYFIAYNDGHKELSGRQLTQQLRSQKVSISCTSSQLVGQWAADLLGLGPVVSEDKVKKALLTILRLNTGAFGAVNAVFPNGEKDRSSAHTEHVWIGLTYCLAALSVYEGFDKAGLDVAKKAWDNVSIHALNPWNQPDMVSSSDGHFLFGDHYMRGMVLWAVVWAMAKKDKQIFAFLKRIKGDERILF